MGIQNDFNSCGVLVIKSRIVIQNRYKSSVVVERIE